MILAENPGLRAGFFCLLYFCQGFPWGFAVVALLAILSSAGHSAADTAIIASMAVLPWTFKLIFAPLIDSFRLPELGIRRPWIALAQFGMASTLLLVWFAGGVEQKSTIMFLAWVLFVHNCFAALQDVATDALAIDLLKDRERGKLMGWMWASKTMGISFGGGGLAIVANRGGMDQAILLQAMIILAVLILVVMVLERRGDKYVPWHAHAELDLHADGHSGFVRTVTCLKQAFSARLTLGCGLVALLAFAGEGLFDPLATEYFVQVLGWSVEEYAGQRATTGIAAEMAGALGGGYLASRFCSRWVSASAFVLMSATLLVFAWSMEGFSRDSAGAAWLVPVFRGSVCFAYVSVFALFMKISWTAAAATQFTIYMTLGNISYVVGVELNSWLPAWGYDLSHQQMFMIGGVLSLLPVMVLAVLDPEEIQERKALASRGQVLLTRPDTA